MLCDQAQIGLMVHSFARVSAALEYRQCRPQPKQATAISTSLLVEPINRFETIDNPNLYGALGVKEFSQASSPFRLSKFLCSVGGPFLCPGLRSHPAPRGVILPL